MCSVNTVSVPSLPYNVTKVLLSDGLFSFLIYRDGLNRGVTTVIIQPCSEVNMPQLDTVRVILVIIHNLIKIILSASQPC